MALALLVAAVPTASSSQTSEEIEIVAGEVVPEHLRPLALTDQDAMIDAWIAHEVDQIRENMVARGAVREVADETLQGAAESFRKLIETTWYGRLESFPNRNTRFSGLTDRDLIDLAATAETEGSVCDAADYRLEFHNRNIRARADTLPEILELQQACRASQ